MQLYFSFNSVKQIIGVLSFAVCLHVVGQDNLYEALGSGPYAVGFLQQDFTRPINSGIRDLKLTIWYPSKEAAMPPYSLASYLALGGESPEAQLRDDLSAMIAGKGAVFSEALLERILSSAMLARKDAAFLNDQFPLLLWSSRLGTIAYQCVLSEYLASHGYVVAYLEDSPASPYPWQLSSAQEKETVLNAHILDLRSGISFLSELSVVDQNQVGLLAWSYAGESAILTQQNDPRVKLVVGLSGLGFTYGVYLGEALKGRLESAQWEVPYLILSERMGSNGKIRKVPEIFELFPALSRHISFTALAHGNFNAVEGYLPGFFGLENVQTWSKSGPEAKVGYESICKLVRSFTDAILKNNSESTFELNSSKILQELPEGFLKISAPGT